VLASLKGPRGAIPLALGKLALPIVPILSHVARVAGLDGAQSVRASQFVLFEHVTPGLGVLRDVGRRHFIEPRRVARQLASPYKLALFHICGRALIPVNEMLRRRIPELFENGLADCRGAAAIFGGKPRPTIETGQLRNGQRIRVLIAVDGGAEGEAAKKTVFVLVRVRSVHEARASRVNRGDGVLGRVSDRLHPIEVTGAIEVVVPLVVDILHRCEIAQCRAHVASRHHSLECRGRNCLGKVTVVAAPGIEMLDQGIDHRRRAQPAPFHQMKRRRVVEVGVGLAPPRNVVEKFRDHDALCADLAQMRAVQLPAIVVDLLKLCIVDD